MQRWAEEANRYEPVLRTHDRYGNRVDEVDFHPSYHALMEVALAEGLAGAPWADDRPGAHVARAAGFMVWSTAEAGHGCPVSMTYAVVPALRAAPDLAAVYEPLLTSRVYDPGLRAPAGKRGLLAGMGMTEKQGGTDVRANTTTAVEQPDGTWRLRGHKWFTSAPMNDLFLVLAQAPAGLSCFLVPRVLPDGSRNTFRIQRLKDKLGNRSNASSEPEFDDTVAWLVGPEGQGVRTIIEMVTMTRLDCILGSASGTRAALAQAAHHARHRSVFGARLIDQPLMRNVIADLGLESEAATTLALRVAGAVDRARRGDAQERAFLRLATAVGKYWVCKRQPAAVAEALECLGGNGYDEASGMPRLYREAPLNGIWEGSGNVNALDVLRALTREPDSSRPSAPRSRPPRAATPASTRRGARCAGNWCPPRTPRCGPAVWSSAWRWCCRVRCSSGTRRHRSRTPSAPPAWPATGAWPSAPSRPGRTWPPSSSACPAPRAERAGVRGRLPRSRTRCGHAVPLMLSASITKTTRTWSRPPYQG